MKDLDEELSKHPPKPKRPLKADFTQVVTSELEGRPERFAWTRFFHLPTIRLASRAGLASLAGLVLLSGSVAAFALWPRPEVTLDLSKSLPNGNRIVIYDMKNCAVQAFDNLPIEPSRQKAYYEVSSSSSLTDRQIQDTLRANCEESASNNAIEAIIKKYQADSVDLYGTMSTLTYTITDITTSSLTVSPDPAYDQRVTTKPNMTYNKFSRDLLVYNENTKATYDDLKVGDSIKMIVRSDSGTTSETPENYNALNHPEHITILAIVKVPALTGNPHILDGAFATDIVRLEKCDANSAGFCRAYDFVR